jgi:hypothetical protein
MHIFLWPVIQEEAPRPQRLDGKEDDKQKAKPPRMRRVPQWRAGGFCGVRGEAFAVVASVLSSSHDCL